MPNKPQPTIPLAQPNNELKIYPGAIPTTPILWPAVQHPSNQIQQTKGSAKPQATGVQPTTQPNQSTVAPRTTPAHVSNVRVVSRNVGGQKNITVQFNHPSGDPYFSGANVYLRSGTKQPVLVASGAKSPLTFTATNDSAPHSVHVTSVGNWGETDVMTSPSAPVKLFGPLNVSKVNSTAFASGGGGTPAPPGATDGLIHGQPTLSSGSWESDPAYVLMRDDFVNIGTSGNNEGNTVANIGQYNWVLAGSIGAQWQAQGGIPPYLGTYGWCNNTTASNGGWLILPSGGSPNAAAGHTSGCMTLFEATSVPWTMTWIFQLMPVGNGNANTAFSTAKKSIYVGLIGPNSGAIAVAGSAVTRPDIFIGLRYDTSTSSPSIGDTFYTLEVVCNGSASTAARHNTQGTTYVTNVAPAVGVWHRVDISSTIAGTVTITLDGSLVNTLTTTVPKVTITGGSGQIGGQIANGIGYVDWAASTNPQGYAPFSVGSVITITGFTGSSANGNGTWTLFNNDSGTNITWLAPSATPGSITAGTVSIAGYPAVTPCVLMGNDDTATPAANMGISVDFFSFIWNPAVGGGTGTPVITKPRYF